MNIPFMQEFTWGDKTYFIEQLWNMCMNHNIFDIETSNKYHGFCNEIELYYDYEYSFENEKLHTIRHISDRFKPGIKVQPYIWTGKPYRSKQFYFMPQIELISKQKIEIKYINLNSDYPVIWIDNKIFLYFNSHDLKILEVLSKNDGFNSIEQFFKYFNKDFIGEIRHFTTLKY
jgi:hypothetical protein